MGHFYVYRNIIISCRFIFLLNRNWVSMGLPICCLRGEYDYDKIILNAGRRPENSRRCRSGSQADGWPVVIVIVDDGGHCSTCNGLDHTQFGSINVAIEKARAAIAFRRPTKIWKENIAEGRLRYLNLPAHCH